MKKTKKNGRFPSYIIFNVCEFYLSKVDCIYIYNCINQKKKIVNEQKNIYILIVTSLLLQWKLSITRSFGPWNFVCYIRYLVISVSCKQYKTKQFISLRPEKTVLYIRYFVISDLFISSFHCTCIQTLHWDWEPMLLSFNIGMVCIVWTACLSMTILTRWLQCPRYLGLGSMENAC